jgi:chromosome segregation ATPase
MNSLAIVHSGDSTNRTCEEPCLKAERDGLRAALAQARGIILDLRSHLADLRAAQEFLRLSYDAVAAEARELQDQLARAQAELAALHAHREALLTERNWLVSVRNAHEARLQELESIEQRFAALADERDTLANRAELLDELVYNLRWEAGPRSIRAVLPLARIIRRIRGS